MNFGFVSTRFSGTDGVSLEAAKWAAVLQEKGHQAFWFSGASDRPAEISQVTPEAHFENDSVAAINREIWNRSSSDKETRTAIHDLTTLLKGALHAFRERFAIDVLVSQNALTIPMNLPLGLALADFIEENGIPAIAHHHDFYWERERFSSPAAQSFLDRAFPPYLPGIAHAVINSEAAFQLKKRLGIEATIIPNVMDFDSAERQVGGFNRNVRAELGFTEDDRLFLQPTRVVPRKGIDHAIELLARLDDPRDHLLLSHSAGDEGMETLHSLQRLAKERRVSLHLIDHRIKTARSLPHSSPKQFTLDDLYPAVDFVTYPSLYEGFGNALLEAVSFRKPLLVNRYSVYRDDIEPRGFQFATMDGEITEDVLADVRSFLEDPARCAAATEFNFQTARKHFGYDLLRKRLDAMIEELVTPPH